MKSNTVELKVTRGSAGSIGLLIKAGGLVIQTEYGELSACEFPVRSSSPIQVEIPPDGTKSFLGGPFSGAFSPQSGDGDYPNTIKFPVYKGQDVVSLQSYDHRPADGDGRALAKIPIVAIGAGIRGAVDGRVFQTHGVLPIWSDGSAVLVRLDWYEGEPSEGTPNPEWHLSASSGMPAGLGLEQLERASVLPPTAEPCLFHLHLTPWRLGAALLGDEGIEIPNRVWQREWQFHTPEEFSAALSRVTGGLLRPESVSRKDAA